MKLQLVRLFNLDLKFGDIPYAGDDGIRYSTIVFGTCPGVKRGEYEENLQV